MTQVLKILLVHPDAGLARDMEALMAPRPYELEVCPGIAEAVSRLKSGAFPLILLDPSLQADGEEGFLELVERFSPNSLVLPLWVGEANPARILETVIGAVDRLSGSLQEGGRARVHRDKALQMAKELQESNLKLMEMDRRKNTCLAVATHELRTPITIVSGYLKLLLGESFGPLNEKQRHLLQESHKNCTRLINLVNSMLDRCRLESDSAEFDYRREAYRKRLQDVAGRMQAYVQESGLTLRAELPDEELILDFDPDAIEQALVNLIGNAVKFTPPPGEITLRCRRTKEGVLTQVIDTGPGIDARDIDHVFDEFNRVGKEYGEKKGAGLGLSICKRIIHAHRGEIWVESEVGKGSCFSFLLPGRTVEIPSP